MSTDTYEIAREGEPRVCLALSARDGMVASDCIVELTINDETQFVIRMDGTFDCRWRAWRPWRRRDARERAARAFWRCVAAQELPWAHPEVAS